MEVGMVEELLQEYAESVRAKDVDRFVALYSDDVRVFDMWGRWSYDGAVAWREMAVEWALRKRPDGAWKVVHEHSSGPVDFETGKVQFQR
jgi:ketosteroid isomerase-like protein